MVPIWFVFEISKSQKEADGSDTDDDEDEYFLTREELSLFLDPNGIEMKEEIGTGTFGAVFRGSYLGKSIAIKKPREDYTGSLPKMIPSKEVQRTMFVNESNSLMILQSFVVDTCTLKQSTTHKAKSRNGCVTFIVKSSMN